MSFEKEIYCDDCYKKSSKREDAEIYEKLLIADRDWMNLFNIELKNKLIDLGKLWFLTKSLPESSIARKMIEKSVTCHSCEKEIFK